MILTQAQPQKECFLPSIDKENHAVNANVPSKKASFFLKKSNKPNTKQPSRTLVITNLEEINNQGPQKNKFTLMNQNPKESSLAKKLNASKVKKLLNFEREGYNVKKEYTNALIFKDKQIIPPKSRFSFLHRNVNRDAQSREGERRSTGANGNKPENLLCDVKEEPMNVCFLKELQANVEKNVYGESSEEDRCFEVVVDPVEQANKMVKEYANDIILSLKEKDLKESTSFWLKNHKISANLRAKMVDWMIEVMCSYKCSDQSFFLAVSIMDSYLQKCEGSQNANDLHLLGVTSMFIAAKYEEIYPMRLSLVSDKIAHRKLSCEEITAKEGEVLQVLNFNLSFATIYDFVSNVVFQLNLKEIMTPDLYDYLQKVCVYLAKANMFDYELMSQYNLCQLAACTLLVAFKVIEQLDPHFPLATMMFKVCEILDVDDSTLYSCAGKTLSLVKGFDKIYPNFKNLKKFHFIGLPGENAYSGDMLSSGARIISDL